MKTIKLPLGLLSSLLLSAGLTKAAEMADPLHARLQNEAILDDSSCRTCQFCGFPTNFSAEGRF